MRVPSIAAPMRLIAAFLLAASHGFAAPAPKPASAPSVRPAHSAADAGGTPSALGFDTSRIRKLYMESEFDEAIALLENDLKGKRSLGIADSILIFKYLGVMYAAKYDTRELGKRYMYRLLALDPSARISDLYASDMIYMIFKNVQDEYFAAHPQTAQPKRPLPKESGNRSGHAAWYWAGGAGLAITAGALVFFLWPDSPDRRIEHPVPP